MALLDITFGSDGDEALIQAFSYNFPFARHLRCFYQNIREKLRSLAIPSKIIEEFVRNIFGYKHGQTIEEVLVNCVSIADFNSKFDALEAVWNAREDPYCSKDGPQFYRYFRQYKAQAVRHNMLRCHREAVGLGCPPAAYTTNASESINALIKQHVHYKASLWPEFNEKLRKLIDSKHEEMVRSLSGRGLYRLSALYSQLGVEPELWLRMRPDQRKKAVKQFEDCSVCISKVSSCRKLLFEAPASTISPLQSQPQVTAKHQELKEPPPQKQQKVLSISAEESEITTLPLVTLQSIW